jgi:hypothetical protein
VVVPLVAPLAAGLLSVAGLAAGVLAALSVLLAAGFASVLLLELLAVLLSDDADDGRLSVMYHPEPLKITGAGDRIRRTVWPVSGSTVRAASWKPWRISKRVPSARSYS